MRPVGAHRPVSGCCTRQGWQQPFELQRWVRAVSISTVQTGNRRRDYRAGTLSAKRAVELEALPGWQRDPNEHHWQMGLAALTGYAEQRGHAYPKRGEWFDDYPVGDRVWAQRTARLNGRLTAARTAQLEAITGWAWIKAD